MNLPDPNWLLSTSVQSAAALVAIIGGFLVSRVLSLSSERSGLEGRIADIKNDLDSIQKKIDDIKNNTYALVDRLLRDNCVKRDSTLKEFNTRIIELQSQEKDLNLRLQNLRKTKGLREGVWALIYFSISGIIFPMVWLPISTDNFSDIHKWIIFGSFVSGLLAVIIYLIWAISDLSK